MDPTIWINERVDIVVVFRRNHKNNISVYPYKMNYKGRQIIFSTLAFRHPTAKGKRMIHIFDASDGSNDYRLSFDAEQLTWTLISIIAGETL